MRLGAVSLFGDWPEGSYHANVMITRAGKTLVEQSSKPIALE